MPRLLAVFAAILLLWTTATDAVAEKQLQLAQNDRATEKVFSDLERRVIREVLGGIGKHDDKEDLRKHGKKAKSAKGAPPGLAKRDRLPPGLQRQLERNGRLPPGLEKKDFPADLRAQLPSPLRGTERVIVGNDAVLIDTATNVILDVIRDVIQN